MAAKRSDDEEVLTTEQAAAFIHHKPDTLRKWRGRGEGPVYSKPGRLCLYLKSDLIAWLRAGRVTAA